MTPAEWCVRNNRSSIIVLILLLAAGLHAFLAMPRLEDPDYIVRDAAIVTYFPGASPQRVEELVTDKLEKKIHEIPEIQYILSQSLAGVSVIMVSAYERYDDMKPIWDRLRYKVAEAVQDLPHGVSDPAVNDEFGDVFGIVIALTGDGFDFRELKDVADRTRDELFTIPKVAKITLFGAQEERIFIEFSNARLAEYGFSPYQLGEMLKSQNVIQPGGEARVGPERVVIEATGEFKSLDQIKKTSLRVPGRAETIYLEDIAWIKRGYVDPPTTMARFNGQPSIILAVSMAEGGNIMTLGRQVAKKLNELNAGLPMGLDYHPLVFQPLYVNSAVNDLMNNLFEALFYVIVVMMLATGMRVGIITATLVPMAMLITFLLMPLFGVNLQRVSIAALIISLGILVDNGVVVTEDILVRMTNGQERMHSLSASTRQLWLPILTSSLTTIFAFLPIATAQSVVGEYCSSLFVVVAVSLLVSWALSMSILPMFCRHFIHPKLKPQGFQSRFYNVYRFMLINSLRWRWLFLIAVIGAMAAGVWAFQFVPKVFFPPNDREMFTIEFWQPYGTDIRTTTQRVSKLEESLLRDEGVVSVGSFVGSGGPRWYLAITPELENPALAFLVVNTKTIDDVPLVIRRARRFIEENFPEARASVRALESGPPVGAPVQIRISGSRIDRIYQLRERIGTAIHDVHGLANIRDDWGEWTKKLLVNVNQEQTKRAGFTSQDIALSLQTQISGLEVTQYREGKDLIPVLIRSRQTHREDLGKIEGLNVYSYLTAASVPLLHLARSELVWQPSNIRRRNEVRTMTLMADVVGRNSLEALKEIMERLKPLIEDKTWPAGYRVEYGGEHEESQIAEASVLRGMPLGIGLLILTLIFQFNSIRRPLIILLTVPPMIVGITPGMIATNSAFGFMAMLGFISLMGVIVNNAILIIDRIEVERANGRTRQEAVVLAAQRRIRPVLLTACTAIAGLIPLSLDGGEMWRSMANVMIFGLAVATIFSLILCPVLYSIFFGANFRRYRWDPAIVKLEFED